MPAGVPCGSASVFCGPLDPPQPKNSATVSTTTATSNHTRCGALKSRRSAASATRPKRSSSHGNRKRKLGAGVRQGSAADDRAVVVAVTVAFTGVVPLPMSGLGETLQPNWIVGGDVQASDTVPLKPTVPMTLTV